MIAVFVLFVAIVAIALLVVMFQKSPKMRASIGGFLEKPLGPPMTAPPLTQPPAPPRLKWNWFAFLLGPLWYLFHGLWVHFILLAGMLVLSGGLLLPFIWLYCALKADEDLFEHRLTRFSAY
ncbi:MAG: DUF2628 domain-containing protein [Armatimonadota bacterium]|nr:DUF2628 domain-containing protein [Armatimonadota bacterium]